MARRQNAECGTTDEHERGKGFLTAAEINRMFAAAKKGYTVSGTTFWP